MPASAHQLSLAAGQQAWRASRRNLRRLSRLRQTVSLRLGADARRGRASNSNALGIGSPAVRQTVEASFACRSFHTTLGLAGWQIRLRTKAPRPREGARLRTQ